MLKALHANKGILTGEECSDCASKKQRWHQLTAMVIATKPTDVVQQTLDVVRGEQSAIEDHYALKELARLLSVRYYQELAELLKG